MKVDLRVAYNPTGNKCPEFVRASASVFACVRASVAAGAVRDIETLTPAQG